MYVAVRFPPIMTTCGRIDVARNGVLATALECIDVGLFPSERLALFPSQIMHERQISNAWVTGRSTRQKRMV